MTNNRIPIELDEDCVLALQQIAASTGESPHAVLRAAVGQAWSKFAADERLYREAAMKDRAMIPGRSLPDIVDLDAFRRHFGDEN